MPRPSLSRRLTARRLAVVPVVVAVGLGVLAVVPPAQALTSVTLANGAVVQINDARRPSLDTGSIRNVSNSRMEGFGNIFVHVDPAAGASAPRMNDQMMRGFGLNGSSSGAYRSSRSVRLGDLSMTRTVQVTAASGTTSFFDTFTNTSTTPMTFDVSFGGSLGYGAAAATSGTVSATSSGDATVDPADTWIAATTPGTYRPTGVVVGTGVDALGDQQNDPFTTAYTQSGSKANDLGFIQELTLAPGATSSLMQYVVVGAQSDTTQIATSTAALAAAPDFSTLSIDQICTLANWDLSTYAAACAGAQPLALPAADLEATGTTDQAYDVTGKTIQQLQTDLSAGRVTSVQLTKAYLDRIRAYDDGALGFHAFITVAEDAVAQALAADQARAAGRTGDLLGVPIAVKDLYDTKDMPTTGGTRALEDWNPGEDAWQVAKLREAGAIIIGKTNLSEFANSGSFSESGFKQTWNALYPSKTSFGSSGGSAVAVATDMAAAAMGTQTGVSLYAPSTGASLSAFRGTDGLTSAAGVMPLTWATDYAGPIAKSITDLASILDATATRATGNDPADLLTNRVDNSLRPTEWKTALTTNALQGKVIGYVPSAFASLQVTDDDAGTVALNEAKVAIEAAGGTLVPLATGSPTTPAAPTGSYPTNNGSGANAEGWERYIAEPRPATFPYTTEQLEESPANLPYNVTANYTQVPYDEVSAENVLKRRDAYKTSAAAWMDTAFTSKVDAVVYPGFLTQAGNNDAASAVFSSDRASGVITQNIGLPTAILPIGKNADGQSNNVQIVGRAWDDTKVLGLGYALEQQVKARMLTTFAPALQWTGPATSTTAVRLGSTVTTVGTPTTATVTVAADPAATGAVRVSVAGTTVTGTLAGGTVTVTLPADLPAGTQLVTASYAGSATVAASSATAMLKVDQGTVSVAVKAKRSHVTRGQKVRLVVTPEAGSPATTSVLVYDGKRVVKTATLGATRSTVSVGKLDLGKHRLKLYVVGGPDYAPTFSSPVTVRVTRR